jgi:hypothetical protein
MYVYSFAALDRNQHLEYDVILLSGLRYMMLCLKEVRVAHVARSPFLPPGLVRGVSSDVEWKERPQRSCPYRHPTCFAQNYGPDRNT